ncbi:MAG TPA: methyltransferase domain-containing protein [Allosphingosinicella sp.]|jgi:predicted methyltransferase
MRKTGRLVFVAAAGALALAGCATSGGGGAESAALSSAHRTALAAAAAAPTRTPANVLRDRYRHPVETLSFFGVRASDTVVEIWPGGGWYTEILAPYLRSGGGTYYAAAMGANGHTAIRRLMEANPALYGATRLAAFPAFDAADTRVPDGTADVVLTFRNVHNWRMGAGRQQQDYSAEAFTQMFRMLRPGGTLGVVDHRLPESASDERERSSGYMKRSTVVRLAAAAGFRLAAESEVNANPLDTADWPSGVWTLPPALRLGDQDRARYQAIGESDRMTLRFIKPR